VKNSPQSAELRKTIDRAGGIVAFRSALGLTHQAVYYWFKIGHVPLERAVEIEARFGTPRASLVSDRVGALLNLPRTDDLI
jgi:hypothetical protein